MDVFFLDRVSNKKAHGEHPLHESLVCDEPVHPITDNRFLVEHRQDLNKNRDYFDIIENNLDPKDPYTYLCYGYELFNRQRYEEALEIFNGLYNPTDQYTTRKGLIMCGRGLKEQNRIEEAIPWYERALSINKPDSTFEDEILYNGTLEEEFEELKQSLHSTYYKIAVYAICGNEIHNIEGWMDSMGEADYICVLDTGSTDGSYDKLLEYQTKYPEKVIIAQKTYNPGRFDTPRNDSLKLVPKDADICICTDLDERLTKTGGDKVRAVGTPKCERGYYLYAWSHLTNGEPARVFGYDKIHANRGEWQGQFPVHEALYHPVYGTTNLTQEQICRLPANFIMLHHYPTYKATRTNYLPLLEMRAEEYPDDFYGLVYLAHEYKYQKQYDKCINYIYSKIFPAIFKNGDDMNCKTDLYMFLGDCYNELDKPKEAEASYRSGIAEDPLFRDNYIHLARLLYYQKRFEEALDIMQNCFKKSRHMYSWLETDAAGSGEPGDLLCLIYWELGAVDMSYMCAKTAYYEDTANDRLKHNVEELEKILKKE